jgi:hypothetical protein
VAQAVLTEAPAVATATAAHRQEAAVPAAAVVAAAAIAVQAAAAEAVVVEATVAPAVAAVVEDDKEHFSALS